MPETAVNEANCTIATQDKVGGSGQTANVESEAEPLCVKCASEDKFGLGVLGRYTCHHPEIEWPCRRCRSSGWRSACSSCPETTISREVAKREQVTAADGDKDRVAVIIVGEGLRRWRCELIRDLTINRSARRLMRKPVPVIDLFSGPGGLAEGFAKRSKRRVVEAVTGLNCRSRWMRPRIAP